MIRRILRFLPPILFFAGLLTLTGCVYLRLLTVKNQLRDFDANFAFGGRRSWYVEFKNPSLYAKDISFLIGAPPLSVSTTTTGTLLSYEFEMVRSTPTAPTALERLSLGIASEGNMLRQAIVPETFLLYFSRRVLEETFRQAKDAQVVKLKKTARADVRLSPEADAELPSLERTLLLLGEPLKSEESGDLRVLNYRYKIIGDKRGVPILVHLSFAADGDLRRAVITWDTSTVDVSFLRQ
jgi:hypothetical protein